MTDARHALKLLWMFIFGKGKADVFSKYARVCCRHSKNYSEVSQTRTYTIESLHVQIIRAKIHLARTNCLCKLSFVRAIVHANFHLYVQLYMQTVRRKKLGGQISPPPSLNNFRQECIYTFYFLFSFHYTLCLVNIIC